jgi:hypothetical protein
VCARSNDRKSLMRKFLSLIITASLALAAVPAQALDNSWITSPSLSAITISGGGATASVSGYDISTQAVAVTMHYTGGAGVANKFAQVNFFDFVGGPGLTLQSGDGGVSSTACDHQTLGGNSHTCFFQLDASGNAAFEMTLTNLTAGGGFKYKLLAGPNIQESQDGQINFVVPTNKIAPVLKNVRGISGGPGAIQFRVTQNGKPSAGVRVRFSFKGVGENLSALNSVSDKHGLVTVYLTNMKFHRGSATVKARIIGGTAVATGYVWWHKVKFL